MTNEQLAESVARVKELDAKIQSMHLVCEKYPDADETVGLFLRLSDSITEQRESAPQMAAIIAQLWDEREQFRTRLEVVTIDGEDVDSADGIACRDETIAEQDKRIKQQEAIIQQQREVMRQAREAVQKARELSSWVGSINWRGGENLRPWLDDLSAKMSAFDSLRVPTLAALDAALKGSE